jgi:spermidine synthase
MLRTYLPQMLAIEAPLPKERVVLRLLEPPDSCRDSLWERLFNGTYDKPFIIDRGVRRFLHFDLFTVQSAMNLLYPERLSLAYTRKMMAFLLFNQTPARILLLGLGGGSLAKFCYWRLPRATITAVELNSDVIALREAFRIPADNERFRVIRAEAANYVEDSSRPKDVILADACDRAGVAPECDTLEFYRRAYHRLSPGGVFVANLCVDTPGSAQIRRIRTVFGDHCMTLRVKQDGNVIVFAFKEPRLPVHWTRLEAAGIALKRQFGLDFPRYVRRARQQNASPGEVP